MRFTIPRLARTLGDASESRRLKVFLAVLTAALTLDPDMWRARAQTAEVNREFITQFGLDTTADTDRDGLSDGFEKIQLGTAFRLADSDWDGTSDFDEALLGTNPLQKLPEITRNIVFVAGLRLDTTGDLDRDALSDGFERSEVGTHPLVPDTDFDGVLDFPEILAGGNPLRAPVVVRDVNVALQSGGFLLDTTQDSDFDTLSDGFERFEFGTSVLAFDTDGDGLSDGEELLAGLNPWVIPTIARTLMAFSGGFLLDTTVDGDVDGLSDGFEFHISRTDPGLFDTDKDGRSDGEEVLFGLDPLNPNRTTPVSLSIGIGHLTETFLVLRLEGTGNPVVSLQGSTDLKLWREIRSVSVEGSGEFFDEEVEVPRNQTKEFFRAVLVP